MTISYLQGSLGNHDEAAYIKGTAQAPVIIFRRKRRNLHVDGRYLEPQGTSASVKPTSTQRAIQQKETWTITIAGFGHPNRPTPGMDALAHTICRVVDFHDGFDWAHYIR